VRNFFVAGLAVLLGLLGLRARVAAPAVPSLWPVPGPLPPPPPSAGNIGWDFEPFTLPDAGGAGEGGMAIDSSVRLTPTLGEIRLSQDAVLAAIDRINAEVFGSWFSTEGRSPLDVLAIAKVESNYTADAVSRAGAVGLMQVLPSTARQFGPWTAQQMIANPELSLLAGMSYLQWSWDALARRLNRPPSRAEWFGAYNAGVGNVLDRGFIPGGYVNKVKAARVSVAVFA